MPTVMSPSIECSSPIGVERTRDFDVNRCRNLSRRCSPFHITCLFFPVIVKFINFRLTVFKCIQCSSPIPVFVIVKFINFWLTVFYVRRAAVKHYSKYYWTDKCNPATEFSHGRLALMNKSCALYDWWTLLLGRGEWMDTNSTNDHGSGHILTESREKPTVPNT